MADIENEIKNELQGCTSAQMLEIVNRAIIATSQAQSYRIGSRQVSRANITELRNLRNQLMQEVEQSNNNNFLFSNCSVAEFEGR